MSETSTKDKVLAANPFPGLRPFKIEESHLFFGREGQSDEVLLKLSKHRFVSVIGPSGSGKSSFIYCGVLPILYGGFLTDASPDWEVIVTRPGAGPIDNLAESLLKNQPEYQAADMEEKKIKRTIISTLLRSSSLGLVEAIEQSRKSKDVNYLVLVDQFEELFRFKDSTDTNSVNETLAFVNLLIEAINYPDAPIYVGITMRSDFIGDCAQFPDLTRKINDSHYLIPQLTRDQKRRAIEGPVAVGGAQITPRLVQQLLNDLGDNPDQLPILQHALMRTWNYWSHYRDYDEEPVDLKHYEAIGTMREALSMHANEAYDELDEAQKQLCEMVFKAITEKRGENFGIRRPTRLSEIAAISGSSEAEVIAVIEKFREPGRSLLTPGAGLPLEGRSMIDISHESLMRIWVRLKNWVDDEAEAVQMYLRLAEASAMYQVGKAGLWRPPDLQLALNWLAKHKPTLVWGQRYHPAFERTMIFLEYSKKEWETEQRIKELEQKRKLQRARITALVLASATVISLVFLVYAFIQKAAAVEAQGKAVKAQKLAEANAKEAQKQKTEADKQREAAVAAQHEAEVQRDSANYQRQQAVEQKSIADQQRTLAVHNADVAKQNEEVANEQKALAQENEKKARLAKAESDRQRYIATAKAMAIKSKELGNDLEQESLIAQQAYNFNTQYNGYSYDNDIYNGLYQALKNQGDPITNSLKGHERGAVRIMITDPTTGKIYSAGSDGMILRWTKNNGKWENETIVPERDNYQIYSIDISPDGKTLIAAGLYPKDQVNSYLEVYDLTNLSVPAKHIAGLSNGSDNVRFTPDGRGAYLRDNAGRSIKYCDLSTVREVIKPGSKINAIDLRSDGQQLAGAGENGSLYLWDLSNNFAEREIKGIVNSSGHLTAVSYGPKGQLIVGDSRGIVFILTPDGTLVRTLPGHTASVQQIVFNHAGTFMATASMDKSVRLWNVQELTMPPVVLNDHLDWVWTVTFTPDDEQLMVGLHSTTETIKGVDEAIHVWPTHIETIANILCGQYIKRNMTQEEWETYCSDLPYVKTCDALPENDH